MTLPRRTCTLRAENSDHSLLQKPLCRSILKRKSLSENNLASACTTLRCSLQRCPSPSNSRTMQQLLRAAWHRNLKELQRRRRQIRRWGSLKVTFNSCSRRRKPRPPLLNQAVPRNLLSPNPPQNLLLTSTWTPVLRSISTLTLTQRQKEIMKERDRKESRLKLKGRTFKHHIRKPPPLPPLKICPWEAYLSIRLTKRAKWRSVSPVAMASLAPSLRCTTTLMPLRETLNKPTSL